MARTKFSISSMKVFTTLVRNRYFERRVKSYRPLSKSDIAKNKLEKLFK